MSTVFIALGLYIAIIFSMWPTKPNKTLVHHIEEIPDVELLQYNEDELEPLDVECECTCDH